MLGESGLPRLLLAALGVYGFLVSARATRNIREVGQRAAAGDRAARDHFTQTRYARVFGPRNSDLGMLFYGALHAVALTGLIRRRAVLGAFFLGSCASLATSAYLLWALFARLRVWCPICMRGHAINAAAFVLLLGLWRRPATVTRRVSDR